MINQENIHRMVQSEGVEERVKAAIELRQNFLYLPSKAQAWADIKCLVYDKEWQVSLQAIVAFTSSFPLVPNRKRASLDLHRMMQDKKLRCYLKYTLALVMPHVTNKEQAWNDLIMLVQEQDMRKRHMFHRWWDIVDSLSTFPEYSKIEPTLDVDIFAENMLGEDIWMFRWYRKNLLGLAFPHVPDKIQAWADLIRLAHDTNDFARWDAMDALASVFPHVHDKMQAWADLHRITQNDDSEIRSRATFALVSAFPHVPDKIQAWADLHDLLKDKDGEVRRRAARVFVSSFFSKIPYKEQAWEDLIQLIQSEKGWEQVNLADRLNENFRYISDKKHVWKDLILLIQNENSDVRWRAANSLCSAFPNISDQKQAWVDLIRLTQNKNGDVRRRAVDVLCIAFPNMLDKKHSAEGLHGLTLNDDCYIRRRMAELLGISFPNISNKDQTFRDLKRLSNDEDSYVRSFANHALGRTYIFKATEAENDKNFRKKLKKALNFFERSSKDSIYLNPASFCLPFYQSFHTIISKKQEAEDEIQKYLNKAKRATKGSENKEKLLEAIENLADALREVQNISEMDFDSVKCNLSSYMQYCERAADLLNTTKENAPGATKLLKKGLPIIDKKIKELLGEIEEKAKNFCKESRQTPFEKISRSTYGSVKGLGKIESPIEAETRLNRLSPLLRSMCSILPQESRGVICSQLEEMDAVELSDKVRIMESALSSIYTQQKNLLEKLDEKDKLNDYFKNLVLAQLSNISFGVFQLKLRSGEIIPTLQDIRIELNKLRRIKTDFDNFGLNLTEFGNTLHQDILRLNNEITKISEEIETDIVPKLPQTDDTRIMHEKIKELKVSKEELWFNRAASLSSIISLLLSLLLMQNST